MLQDHNLVRSQCATPLLLWVQVLSAAAYVFCADLQSVPAGGAHSVSFINFALVQDTRPATSDWPSIAPEGPHIYARIAVRRALSLSFHTHLCSQRIP